MNRIDGYTVEEFRTAFAALPRLGLEQSALTLLQALEGAADQREEYWKNRVQPFWQQYWPKSSDRATPQIAETFARLIIAAGAEFPAALAVMQDWLQPIAHSHFVVSLLHESGLCRRYPADALRLLDAVIADQQWTPQDLGQCLDEISEGTPKLEQDANYQRSRERFQRHRLS